MTVVLLPTFVSDDYALKSVVTRTHSTFGDMAFAAVGAGLWNSLPPNLRDADLPYNRDYGGH